MPRYRRAYRGSASRLRRCPRALGGSRGANLAFAARQLEFCASFRAVSLVVKGICSLALSCNDASGSFGHGGSDVGVTAASSPRRAVSLATPAPLQHAAHSPLHRRRVRPRAFTRRCALALALALTRARPRGARNAQLCGCGGPRPRGVVRACRSACRCWAVCSRPRLDRLPS